MHETCSADVYGQRSHRHYTHVYPTKSRTKYNIIGCVFNYNQCLHACFISTIHSNSMYVCMYVLHISSDMAQHVRGWVSYYFGDYARHLIALLTTILLVVAACSMHGED